MNPRRYLTEEEWAVFNYFRENPMGQGLSKRIDAKYFTVAERLAEKGVLTKVGLEWKTTDYGTALWNWEPGYPEPKRPT